VLVVPRKSGRLTDVAGSLMEYVKPNTLLNLIKSAKTTYSSINAICLNSKVPYLLIIKVDFSLLFRPINYASLKAITLLLLHLLLSTTLLLNALTEFSFALKHN
jgi:hypothetical protein